MWWFIWKGFFKHIRAKKDFRYYGDLYMEYYSFIFTFLGIFVTLLIAIWGTYSLKRNKKKIRFRLFIILCILFFLFIVYTFFYFKQLRENREKNNQLLIEEYYTFFDTENYHDAIRMLDNLMVEIGDDEDKLYLINYNKATCYILLGFSESNNEYLEKAIKILDLLRLKETKYSKEYNNTIRILLGEIFLYLEEPVYRTKLEVIVNELEEVVKNGGYQYELALYFLGSFYYEQFEKTVNEEYLLKAEKYLSEGTKNDVLIIDNSEEYLLFHYMLEKVAFCLCKISMQPSKLRSDESIENLERAIDIYYYLINNVDINKSMEDYLKYKKYLGRCLIFLGDFQNNNDYIYQGVEMLKYVINFKDEKFDSIIVGIGYIYIMTNIYEQEDINMLFKKYNRLLMKYDTENNITEIVELYKDMAISYYFLAKQNRDTSYYDKGIEIIELLENQYYPMVNELNKYAIDTLKELYSLY